MLPGWRFDLQPLPRTETNLTSIAPGRPTGVLMLVNHQGACNIPCAMHINSPTNSFRLTGNLLGAGVHEGILVFRMKEQIEAIHAL